MGKEDENPTTPIATKPTSSNQLNNNNNNNNKEQSPPLTINSQSSSSHPKISEIPNADDSSTPLPKNPLSPQDFILSVASKIASQPLHCSDPDVWGVLTAISDSARKRHQGMNMLLTSNEHCIGRLVKDTSFQIVSPAVSANHCKIYRKRAAAGDGDNSLNFVTSVFLKDSSTNGTYLNWEKLNKGRSEAKLHHGDIISVAFPPEHGNAVAFVFREVLKLSSPGDGAFLKRKAEELGSESKKLKGIGIGASEGPISLDDFRSLQRSNMELRKMLEDQVVTIESLRTENRASIKRRETEMKDLIESISEGYLGQLKEVQQLLEDKEKELMDSNRISSEQKHALEDLNERLGASMQSCVEANEIISSQKTSISELKALLDEEREQRREEREKAVADLKTSIQRIQAEAKEEMQRLSDAAVKREKEQQEVINKLQESEKERCSLVETLRSKLEDTREKLVMSENKVRQLEAQVREEQLASATRRKRVDELELDIKRLRKELEREKAAREEAWAKVSALELEINAAMRDLDFERRRLKGARERIMLRETQLRAFYSTTEEIQILFAKQQEQLKAMQRTLEDEENYQNTSVDIDLNLSNGHIQGFLGREKEVNSHSCSAAKAGSSSSTQRHDRDHDKTSSDEVSVTEKHDCNMKIQGNDEDTQEVEFTGAQCSVKGGFGSDIDAVGTTHIPERDPVGVEINLETDGMETAPVFMGELVATERILETESPGHNGGSNIDLNKCDALVEDTMQLVDQSNGEATGQAHTISQGTLHHSQSNSPLGVQNPMLDTQGGGSIRTADLLASEVPGSWACSTAPSVHGENDSPKSNNEDGAAALPDSVGMVAESQNVPSLKTVGARWNKEHQALSEMIGIVAPDMKEHFACAIGSNYDKEGAEREDASDSDTESCSENDDNPEANNGGESDAETIDGGREKDDPGSDNAMDVDDEATQDDSYG
ncbi:hypothetical protein ACH5RR_000295 [Cinchona calisaya]|uniref:FHA domain-containing protein n=1 Tax=Cinchona calisaya TaxID=153742 RepID=A0ABD3B166_9GENT